MLFFGSKTEKRQCHVHHLFELTAERHCQFLEMDPRAEELTHPLLPQQHLLSPLLAK